MHPFVNMVGEGTWQCVYKTKMSIHVTKPGRELREVKIMIMLRVRNMTIVDFFLPWFFFNQ